MCQDHHHDRGDDNGPAEPSAHQRPGNGGGAGDDYADHEPFPWDVGVFDAHCHPTDTMASIDRIPAMAARALTVMATRSQDQHLVAEVAKRMSVEGRKCLSEEKGAGRIVPCFGWHPWFSHQLYDDGEGGAASAPSKEEHYKAVLVPPPDDAAFLASFPDPVPLSSFIASTREQLTAHPLALVGEVGIDKAFRLPQHWTEDSSSAEGRDSSLTPGGREGRPLSPHRVRLPHQRAVLTAQLRLAGSLGRAVSLHGVQAHGALYDAAAACWKGHEREVLSRRKKRLEAMPPGTAVDEDDDDDESQEGKGSRNSKQQAGGSGKPYPPRLCLHSYSGSAEMLKQWLHPSVPCDVYVSFSAAINAVSVSAGADEDARARVADAVRAVPEDRLLIESDLHIAGPPMDAALEDVARAVCAMRGWSLREGVERLRANYERFIFG